MSQTERGASGDAGRSEPREKGDEATPRAAESTGSPPEPQEGSLKRHGDALLHGNGSRQGDTDGAARPTHDR